MNIVFDLGGVVFRWQPDAIIRSVFDDSDIKDLIREEIFEHPDWVELDKGTLALTQAIERGATRTGLPRQDVERDIEGYVSLRCGSAIRLYETGGVTSLAQ